MLPPAESASPMFVMAPVSEIAPCCGKGSQKMTESTWEDGTSCQHFLGNSLGKTLGIAISRDETWCSGKTHNVHGKLGRHDGRVKRNRNMFRWSIYSDG